MSSSRTDRQHRISGELRLAGDETTPQTVTLEPWGTLTGRIIGKDGEPQSGGSLTAFSTMSGYRPIGKDGRFRVERLVPGKVYTFRHSLKAGRVGGLIANEITLTRGEVKDLGDVIPEDADR